jgi:hypothetical protein
LTGQKKQVVIKERDLKTMNLKIIELQDQRSQKSIHKISIRMIMIVRLQIEIHEKIEEEV